MVQRWINLVCAAVVVALAGCAATVQAPSAGPKLTVSAAAAKQLVLVVDGSKVAKESKDWEAFRGEWRIAIEAAAKEAGITAQFRDTVTAAATQQPAVLAVVNINDYRYITQGARFAVGIMTGNAFVDAEVSFSELPGNVSAGTRKYNTASSAGQGIFAAMTEKQIKAICDAIVKEVAQR
jgi:hypothetical protein